MTKLMWKKFWVKFDTIVEYNQEVEIRKGNHIPYDWKYQAPVFFNLLDIEFSIKLHGNQKNKVQKDFDLWWKDHGGSSWKSQMNWLSGYVNDNFKGLRERVV